MSNFSVLKSLALLWIATMILCSCGPQESARIPESPSDSASLQAVPRLTDTLGMDSTAVQ